MDNEQVTATTPVEETVAPVEETATEATEATANTEASAPAADERAERRPYHQGQPNHRRKKVCLFCQDKVTEIDYKDVLKLRKFVSERGKILPKRVTGTCAMHQRQVTTAIKRARYVALLPYTAD